MKTKTKPRPKTRKRTKRNGRVKRKKATADYRKPTTPKLTPEQEKRVEAVTSEVSRLYRTLQKRSSNSPAYQLAHERLYQIASLMPEGEGKCRLMELLDKQTNTLSDETKESIEEARAGGFKFGEPIGVSNDRGRNIGIMYERSVAKQTYYRNTRPI